MVHLESVSFFGVPNFKKKIKIKKFASRVPSICIWQSFCVSFRSGQSWRTVCGDGWTFGWSDFVCEQLVGGKSVSTEVRRYEKDKEASLFKRPKVKLVADASARSRSPVQYALKEKCNSETLVHLECHEDREWIVFILIIICIVMAFLLFEHDIYDAIQAWKFYYLHFDYFNSVWKLDWPRGPRERGFENAFPLALFGLSLSPTLRQWRCRAIGPSQRLSLHFLGPSMLGFNTVPPLAYNFVYLPSLSVSIITDHLVVLLQMRVLVLLVVLVLSIITNEISYSKLLVFQHFELHFDFFS